MDNATYIYFTYNYFISRVRLSIDIYDATQHIVDIIYNTFTDIRHTKNNAVHNFSYNERGPKKQSYFEMAQSRTDQYIHFSWSTYCYDHTMVVCIVQHM